MGLEPCGIYGTDSTILETYAVGGFKSWAGNVKGLIILGAAGQVNTLVDPVSLFFSKKTCEILSCV